MKVKEFGLVIGAILLLTASLSAETLLIDFGATAATSTASTNNPAGVAPSAAADWNLVGGVASASLSFYADGTAATGVSINEGSSATASIVNWTAHPTASNLGTSIVTNDFASGNPAYGAVFDSGASNIGMQVSGLAAGTYNLFVVGVNTNSSTPVSETFFAGDTGSSLLTSSSYNFTSLPLSATESNSGISTSTWVAGTDYQELTVTIANSGDILTLVAEGGGTTALNMLEIVAVPEPRTWAELAFGAFVLFFVVRRRNAWAV